MKIMPLSHRSFRFLSAEKVNILLLIVASLWVTFIHVGSMPYWMNFTTAGIMAWRAWLTFTGRPLPARWILMSVAVALSAANFWHFGTFFGREPGVALLTMLIALKMLEMHKKADLFIVIFLGFFLLLTSFFQSQSLVNAAQVALGAILFLLAQLSFQYCEKVPSLWLRIKLVLKMVALAIPITIVGFFLFPRIQGPLWGLPNDANAARSGLSDSMSPGNISKLAMSDELVFRAKFFDTAPDKSQMYWRAMILNGFDGRTWSQGMNQAVKVDSQFELDVVGAPVRQQIILEPSANHYLFALDMLQRPPQLSAASQGDAPAQVLLHADGSIESSQTIDQRLRYEASSYPRYRLSQHADPSTLQQALRLPRNANPQTLAFAQAIRTQFPNAGAQVRAVLQFFRQEKFYYTLEPPPLGKHSVDDFLFNTRAGFCEHYSSAFVILMRALGIPARVVTGYQGGTLNTQDGYFEIRQSDAHAWAEIWTSDSGWLRIDPTGAVAPERIQKNLKASQKPGPLADLMSGLLGEDSWLRNIQMRWSALNNAWNQWVLNYNEAKQSNLFKSLGLSELDWPKTLGTLFAIGALVVAVMAIPLLQHRPKISALDKLYYQFCRKLQKLGYARQIHEGPHDFLQRLQPHIAVHQYRAARSFIGLYTALKYGKKSDAVGGQLQRLKFILQQLK